MNPFGNPSTRGLANVPRILRDDLDSVVPERRRFMVTAPYATHETGLLWRAAFSSFRESSEV
jgi:hypothetical protein